VDRKKDEMEAKAGTSKDMPLPAGLYLVATPIGNLGDITLRALETLRSVDCIACEDKRVTVKLLSAHTIKTPLVSYHEHNAAAMRPRLIARMNGGERIALVSDAGTPLISDPGYKLAQDAREQGVSIQVIPGVSAVLAALVASGQPSDAFHFAGFLPPKKAARQRALEGLVAIPGTLILFESARRLGAMLADANAVLGPRPASVCRELTKFYEETRSQTLDQLAAHYAEQGAPKGEIVVVIGRNKNSDGVDDAEIERQLVIALETKSLRDAVADVTAVTGVSKRKVYAHALALSQANPEEDP
jgi:16S rRNA (cytidine1402-2'-O)-methyltransferase